tara:strand:- start:1686 stop:2390 length:705 start_codon:yes stop_codon:yes gene_type:complete
MCSDTLIIIPAYNEGKSILKVITSIRNYYSDIDILVIDDGSTDDTAMISNKAGAVVLSHPFNIGYGASLQTGYKYAVYNQYNFLIQIDGDGQHDIKGIGDLIRNLKECSYDVILGSRFLGKDYYKLSIFRLFGIRLFRLFIYLLTKQKISDPTTGFQAIKKKVLKLYIQDLFPSDYPDADIIILLSKLNINIKEIPVVMYPNREGKSMHKNPINVLYYLFKVMLSICVTLMRKD